MQNFSERLEIAIERSQKRKGDLADYCGVALSTVSRWLAGSVPKADTIERIAEFLNVEAKWLVFGGDDLADDAKLRDDVTPYRVSKADVPAEPTMAEAFHKLGEALDMLKKLMENMPKDPKP